MTKNDLLQHKIVVICRKIYGENLLNLAQALYDGGIRFIEVTFDQSDANCIKNTCFAVESLIKQFENRLFVGTGTTLTIAQVDAAKTAGALYVVSPNTDCSVIEHTKKAGLFSIPGAMTPTEIQNAHLWGADTVKIFPAAHLGLQFIKDIRSPFSHIDFLAAGGITEENITAFSASGYNSFGISGRLTDSKLISAKNFAEFTKRAQEFVKKAQST